MAPITIPCMTDKRLQGLKVLGAIILAVVVLAIIGNIAQATLWR